MSSSNESRYFDIDVDGQLISVQHGQTIAAALAAAGRRVLRRTQSSASRGLFCGMGVCFECLVMVDGTERRACITPVRPGMRIHLLAGKETFYGDD